MTLQRQFDQAGDQFRVAEAARLPQLRIHADVSEPRQRVDFIDHHLVFRRQEHIHARHAAAAERLISANGDRPDLIINRRIEIRRHDNLRAFIINVFGVVRVEVAV